MKKILIFLFSFLVSLSYGQEKTNVNVTYDVVILNGRVIDPETMFDDVANVGIKDGKIVIITKSQIKGKETIDATGHVVAPWFYRHTLSCNRRVRKQNGTKRWCNNRYGS